MIKAWKACDPWSSRWDVLAECSECNGILARMRVERMISQSSGIAVRGQVPGQWPVATGEDSWLC